MHIWLNPDDVGIGVTHLDVRNALANNNFPTAAGQLKAISLHDDHHDAETRATTRRRSATVC